MSIGMHFVEGGGIELRECSSDIAIKKGVRKHSPPFFVSYMLVISL